jgi:hypothetical protein
VRGFVRVDSTFGVVFSGLPLVVVDVLELEEEEVDEVGLRVLLPLLVGSSDSSEIGVGAVLSESSELDSSKSSLSEELLAVGRAGSRV